MPMSVPFEPIVPSPVPPLDNPPPEPEPIPGEEPLPDLGPDEGAVGRLRRDHRGDRQSPSCL
ncbi:hypothetical protein ELH66_28025 (plasmid) [Rhizobium ruizarguesonis]|nr:hypothetical protein ELH66_28025 [Rhizobium ruizarguesonis]